LEEFREAFREGFTEFESLKRYTAVGTGFCQGKGCLGEAAGELARLRKLDPSEIRPTTIRQPAEPQTFAQIAALPVPDALDEESDFEANEVPEPGTSSRAKGSENEPPAPETGP
jgi:hypothetical protein